MKILLIILLSFLLFFLISIAVAVGVNVGMQNFFDGKGVKNGKSETTNKTT